MSETQRTTTTMQKTPGKMSDFSSATYMWERLPSAEKSCDELWQESLAAGKAVSEAYEELAKRIGIWAMTMLPYHSPARASRLIFPRRMDDTFHEGRVMESVLATEERFRKAYPVWLERQEEHRKEREAKRLEYEERQKALNERAALIERLKITPEEIALLTKPQP